ncbi:ribosomal-processing cysteine protease Prp [Virgibacillus halophilus]|uniref:ribosomal-processing cysteine protease Prp n=1 Tax=Tigheibacillus halophilus TaxID=361280 RepID=UPI00362FE10C
MIQANIYFKDSRAIGFEVAGHANSGPYGYDLVCAAVSAITFGTVNAVMTLCDVHPDVNQGEDGYLYVKIPHSATDSQKDKASFLFEGMLVSLQTVEQEYSDFITIEKKSL